jgi:regulator of cell morphogenesis and NO signaling
MTINSMNTVGEMAVTIPGATRIFEQFGIDYCCGGQRSLSDTCRTHNIEVVEVVRSLEALRETPNDSRDWRGEPLVALSTHIVDKHHCFTRQEIDRLEKLFDKVCSRHGENHPELFEAHFPRAIEMEEAGAPELQSSANSLGEHRCFAH